MSRIFLNIFKYFFRIREKKKKHPKMECLSHSKGNEFVSIA
nr:MAG TPA: hypothetical protein [Caudoviricetes sp.]